MPAQRVRLRLIQMQYVLVLIYTVICEDQSEFANCVYVLCFMHMLIAYNENSFIIGPSKITKKKKKQ